MINSNISTAIGKYQLIEKPSKVVAIELSVLFLMNSFNFNFSFATFAFTQIIHLIQLCIVLKIQSFLGNAMLNF